MKVVDQGILIHRINYSESSLICTFYTRNSGLKKMIYQGGKKKGSVLFPLNCCELTFYHRSDSELDKLTQCESQLPLDQLLLNPIKSSIAFLIADVLKQTLHTNEKELAQYDYIQNSIELLNLSNDVSHFPLYFLANFTKYLGFYPSTDEGIYFDLQEGEFYPEVRLGALCLAGEDAQIMRKIFNEEHLSSAQRKVGMSHLLHYYKLHTPGFDVSKSLEIVSTILAD